MRPENTIPAFEYAIEQGVDAIEMDVAVDCARDDIEPARIELDLSAETTADRGDPLAVDGDIGDDRLLRRHDEAAPDDEVVAQHVVL